MERKFFAIAVAALTFTSVSLTSFASDITLDRAKEIALEHAGLTESQVTFVKNKKEIDDGKAQYEIEFVSGSTEYDYDIDASTGKIISFDQDIEDSTYTTKTSPKADSSVKVTKDQALQIALDHAGLTTKDVTLPKVKKDHDDGKEVYEVEFHVGFNEYSYNIDVATGEILDFEIDD